MDGFKTDRLTAETLFLEQDAVREAYREAVTGYLQEIKLVCARYGITYAGVDIAEPFARVFNTFLVQRQRFA